jgi:predicted regulator of Ras-like GTPase activity (Roadblock/LC7/MglB family)
MDSKIKNLIIFLMAIEGNWYEINILERITDVSGSMIEGIDGMVIGMVGVPFVMKSRFVVASTSMLMRKRETFFDCCL